MEEIGFPEKVNPSLCGPLFGESMGKPDLRFLFGIVDSPVRNVHLNRMDGKEISSYCYWQNPELCCTMLLSRLSS